MQLEYVPLLQKACEFYRLPRNMERFQAYLRLIADPAREHLTLVPFVAMNPMAKDHVLHRIEEYIELGTDEIAEETIRELKATFTHIPGSFHVGIVFPDDVAGGWTNRYANEYAYRFPSLVQKQSYDWLVVYLWVGDQPSARGVKEAVRMAMYRFAYLHEFGFPNTLREKMEREGRVMALSGCDEPTLEIDDLEYTRWVIEPFLESTDMRTAIECLFGDAGGKTLGFTPRGLSPYAGLALALHDAKTGVEAERADSNLC